MSVIKMARLTRINSDGTKRAWDKIFKPLPKHMGRSTTLDNGSENVGHVKLREDLDMDTYFADPYPAWQRGGNENVNLRIRYYFPKGTGFSKMTDEEIRDVEWELNNRPRKRLGFKTSMETSGEVSSSTRGIDLREERVEQEGFQWLRLARMALI